MLYLRYIASELRRRRGRTILTALGLGIGVGLVVTVTALSAGLDDAQSEVLEPLTGVGTDMTVKRPIDLGGDAASGGPIELSAAEQRRLEREGAGPPRLDFDELGDPGERFSTDQFVSTDLSFPASEVREVAATEGVEAVSPALTLNLIHIEGRVPEATGDAFGIQAGPLTGGGEAGPGGFGLDPLSVTGVDATQRDLGLVTAEQVTEGRFLRPGDVNAALLTSSYAAEQGLGIGDRVPLGERKLEVVGLVKAPLGGDSSDIYARLETVQRAADREGRINALEVRAADVDSVDAVAASIEDRFAGAEVTTASELSERVSGSLVSAQNLSDKLGGALAAVALVAAVLIACLLTLSSVNKRTRELGTLKALGWRRWLVVRQVSGEAVAQGLLGGAFGALIGLGGAAIVNALDISLKASAEAATQGFGPPGAEVVSGTSSVSLDAPVDPVLLALAIALAIAGGLIAGIVGGARAAGLRPAEALRSVE